MTFLSLVCLSDLKGINSFRCFNFLYHWWHFHHDYDRLHPEQLCKKWQSWLCCLASGKVHHHNSNSCKLLFLIHQTCQNSPKKVLLCVLLLPAERFSQSSPKLLTEYLWLWVVFGNEKLLKSLATNIKCFCFQFFVFDWNLVASSLLGSIDKWVWSSWSKPQYIKYHLDLLSQQSLYSWRLNL